jgi:hypothetical protein
MSYISKLTKALMGTLLLMAFLHTGCGSMTGKKALTNETPQSSLVALLPGDALIDGWRMIGAPVFYSADNLFEYIDGKAEEFIAYDFHRLASAQYSPDGSEDGTVTIDIYDMGADASAFGIYSYQRYPEADYVEIGGQGFFTEASLEFWRGRYFVKMLAAESSDVIKDVMARFGQHVSSNIKGDVKLPVILSYLPKKGYVVNSAVFALKDIMGQSFLKNGVEADYIIDGSVSRLFLAQYTSSEEALEAFNSYSKFLRESGGKIEPLSNTGERAFATEVSFYGRVIAFHQGDFVGGILGAPEGPETEKLLDDVLSKLGNEITTGGDL